MYSDEDLAAAVEAKILSADNVAAFRAFMAAQRQSAVADEEQFRLVTSFNDIFVTIACILVFWAASAFDVPLLLKAAVIAAGAWALAEYFTRLRRMALPSIAFETFPGLTTSCRIKQGLVCAYNLFVTEAQVLLPSSNTESIFACAQINQ